MYSISFFILAGDYEPAYAPAKKFNIISSIIRGAAVIVAYYCVGYHSEKTVYLILILALTVMFLANLALDILSAKIIINHFPETEKISFQKIEEITEEDVKNFAIYRKAVTKAVSIPLCFSVSMGLLISVGITLNLFRNEPPNAAMNIFRTIECLIIFWCIFISYKNLIIRIKLYYPDTEWRKKCLRFELVFLTLGYAVALGCAVMGFIDASIQILPMIASVVLLVPIFKTNRKISIKIKFIEAKIKENISVC